MKNKTEFTTEWLRIAGFIGNMDDIQKDESDVFSYRELMDYNGIKEIKIHIVIDLVVPTASRILFQYVKNGYLKEKSYKGEITSPKVLGKLLDIIYPECRIVKFI